MKVTELIDEAMSQRKEHLNLSNSNLMEFPNMLFQLDNLTTLDLSNNHISNIPDAISRLINLTQLDLSNNQISTLPPTLSNLVHLERLYLNNNSISELPISLTNLYNLTSLNLSNNQICALPKDIKNLENLAALFLKNNPIQQLSKIVSSFKKLIHLDLRGTKITQIPMAIAEHFSYDFSLAEHVLGNGLFVSDVPLKLPPIEIINNGIVALKDYYFSIKKEKKVLNEVKILIVGEGAAGKTSLLNLFQGKPFDRAEKQTQGINIAHNDIETDDGIVKTHYWDFGGQEIMHATHQFFLSKRSLYILVIDKRREEKSEYWLKLIESFGGDSPIIVVLNKMDENPSFNVNKTQLSEKYKNIKGFFHVSCKTQSGIEDLKIKVAELLGQTPLFGTVWATKWFKIKALLEAEIKPFIPYEEYKNICKNLELNDDSTQQTLIRFLNDLGSIIHFNDPMLEHTHVLKPRWITEAVYRIINSDILAINKGLLHREDLKEILKKKYIDDFDYPLDKHDYIINLMKKFEICYPCGSNDVLLPSLLDVETPKFEFNKRDSINFIVEYDFLPKSTFLRFMVQMNNNIETQWRTGFILNDKRSGSKALITVDSEQKKIYFTVNGKNRKDYFAFLLFTLRQINKSFEKLKSYELIPMPDNPLITIGYEDLLFQLEEGQNFCFPPNARKKYPIKELLGIVTYVDEPLETIINLLNEIDDNIVRDDPDSLYEGIDRTIMLKPNICGIGIDFNAVLKIIGKKDFKKKLQAIAKTFATKK